MTQPALDPGPVWTPIVVLGHGTVVLRLSFVQLYAWIEGFPPGVERALGCVPAAILAALVTPALVSLPGPVLGGIVSQRTVAGAVAAVTAR